MQVPQHAHDFPPRPSSWPIRRERQHAAHVRANQQIIAKLDAIEEKLASFELRLGPPGLHQSQLQERINRSECLVVCNANPSVDQLLTEMLKKKQPESPRCQPECEQSPGQPSPRQSLPSIESIQCPQRKLIFDIYDASESENISSKSMQTDVLTMFADKSRCHSSNRRSEETSTTRKSSADRKQ